MPELIDVLWRESMAPAAGRRGPRPRVSVGRVIETAVAIADDGGLGAVSIRTLAQRLEMTPMSLYTHVDSREDLIVLMADHVLAGLRADPAADREKPWRARVRQIAETNRTLLIAHSWLLEVHDPRAVLGPGAIAKYDRELAAFDGLPISDQERDAMLSYVLDFARSGAQRQLDVHSAGSLDWSRTGEQLAQRIGERYPLAQRVGAATGDELGAAYDADAAWNFGVQRMLDGLEPILER